MGLINYAFFLFVLFDITQLGLSIKCYNCIDSADCGDPFKKETSVTTCDETEVCIKHITKYIEFTIRNCEKPNYCDDVTHLAKHCSTCSTNLCNASSTLTSSFVITLLTIIKCYF